MSACTKGSMTRQSKICCSTLKIHVSFSRNTSHAAGKRKAFGCHSEPASANALSSGPLLFASEASTYLGRARGGLCVS